MSWAEVLRDLEEISRGHFLIPGEPSLHVLLHTQREPLSPQRSLQRFLIHMALCHIGVPKRHQQTPIRKEKGVIYPKLTESNLWSWSLGF